MESSQRLPMGKRDSINVYGIVYSPNKYRETEGKKDLFNKSHSYSYAVICFQTAYLKTYYPLYFFKALLNQHKNDAGSLNKYILDARQFNISVVPPNINKSDINFTVDDNKVLFGFSAINGIGQKLAEQILSLRNTKFTSMKNFLERVNPTKAQVISLIKSGAIPTKNKKQGLIKYLKSQYEPLTFKPVQSLPTYAKLVNDHGIDIEKYRTGNKKYDYNKEALLIEYNRVKHELFNEQEKIRYNKYIEQNSKYLENEDFWEFEALQIFISDNPFDKAYNYLPSFESINIGEKCAIVGVIAKVQKKKDKHKKQFAFINIYSTFGIVEGIVWHSTLKEYEDYVKNGAQLAFLVRKEAEDKVVVEQMKPYSVWIEQCLNKKKGIKQ